jgi:hypothetical protein
VPSEPPQEQQQVAADTEEELDFNAVQRGDAEMENRMNRLVRACAEPGDRNPILSIHDQVTLADRILFGSDADNDNCYVVRRVRVVMVTC